MSIGTFVIGILPPGAPVEIIFAADSHLELPVIATESPMVLADRLGRELMYIHAHVSSFVVSGAA